MSDVSALIVRADILVRAGQYAEARAALDEAAAMDDEAMCLQFAGTLSRFEGDLAGAATRCARALDACGGAGPAAVLAHTELGEIALVRGDHAAAVAAFGAALAANGEPAAPLLRRRATAYSLGGRPREAVRDLDAAYGIVRRAGDRAGAIRTLIEKATVEQEAGLLADAAHTIGRALGPASQHRDHAALADLHLLRAAQAVGGRDVPAAAEAAQRARTEALAARAPGAYIGAAHAIARLAEAAGDRPAAYAALAAGWATLGDLVGPDLARMAFESTLRDLRDRWGAAFGEIKRTYEAGRRRAGSPA